MVHYASQSQYEGVGLLLDCAQSVHELCQRVESFVGEADGHHRMTPETVLRPQTPSVRAGRRPARGRGSAVRGRRVSNGKAPKGEYPQFLREGEELVKVGWSKRKRSEYRHKAPKRLVMLVARAIERAAVNGERIVMEKAFPVSDPELGGDVPSYQAYLTLAWLRKEKLINQHGRQGYSLIDDSAIEENFEQRWNRLQKA
jgi:hypothetical protein